MFEALKQKWRQRKLRKYPYSCYFCKKYFESNEMMLEANKILPKIQCCEWQIIQLHAFTSLMIEMKADCEIIDVNSPKALEQRLKYNLNLDSWEFIVKNRGLNWNKHK